MGSIGTRSSRQFFVLNREGQEIQFYSACYDLRKYIEDLGPEDAVILEASSGAFWWADRIEAQGSACYVLDPHKFRIIKDSWKKTDKYDSRNMVKALWVYMVTGEFGIPEVYKPSAITRELRKLFSQYGLLNRQIRMLKNSIQAILMENGIILTSKGVCHLISQQQGFEVLKELDISEASRIGIKMSMELLWNVLEKKDQLHREILLAGEPLEEEVKRLITIKGITPLTALAFLADVGDVRRFKSLRKMNAYLGLVPRVKDSGGTKRSGHINRESRKLTRTILTQSIHHVSNSSLYLNDSTFYNPRRSGKSSNVVTIRRSRQLCSSSPATQSKSHDCCPFWLLCRGFRTRNMALWMVDEPVGDMLVPRSRQGDRLGITYWVPVQSIEPMHQEGGRTVMIKTIEIDTGQSVQRYGLAKAGFTELWEIAGLASWSILVVV